LPLYEYRCASCGYQYEKREGFEAAPLQTCPQCGGSARRVLHPPPIVFKGSGFYVTDNRRPSYGGDGPRTEALPSGEKAQLAGPSSKGDGGTSPEGGSSSEEGAPSETVASS
jgi:putative FmdB family regulatory protein